jgi:ABC-type bacteriocin/lantibiotic exporter with double-glycine peptidase domain
MSESSLRHVLMTTGQFIDRGSPKRWRLPWTKPLKPIAGLSLVDGLGHLATEYCRKLTNDAIRAGLPVSDAESFDPRWAPIVLARIDLEAAWMRASMKSIKAQRRAVLLSLKDDRVVVVRPTRDKKTVTLLTAVGVQVVPLQQLQAVWAGVVLTVAQRRPEPEVALDDRVAASAPVQSLFVAAPMAERAPEPVAETEAAPQAAFAGFTLSHASVAGERAGLTDLDLMLTRGETVALVGRSGAGKSLFLRLLAGVVVPTTGLVTCEGTRPRAVGVLPQDLPSHVSLDLDLMDGASPALRAALLRMLARAGISVSDCAATLAAGLPLASGQRRLLTLAHALLAGTELCLLDDPLAGLDRESQGLAQQAILAARDDRLLLIASHTRGLIEPCDRVLWFDRGQIRANGAPAQVIGALAAATTAQAA